MDHDPAWQRPTRQRLNRVHIAVVVAGLALVGAGVSIAVAGLPIEPHRRASAGFRDPAVAATSQPGIDEPAQTASPSTAVPEPTPQPATATASPTLKTTGPTTTTKVGNSTQTGVTPGAFCKPEGALGRTVTGLRMRCTRRPGEKQPRWRAVGQPTTPTKPATTPTTTKPTTPAATPSTTPTTTPTTPTTPPGAGA